MAVKMDERVARCFGTLKMPEFTPLMEFLNASRNDSLEKLAQATDTVALHRLQGEIKVYKDLISYVEKSESLVSNLKR